MIINGSPYSTGVPLATKTSRRTVHGLASAALLMHLWLAWDIAPEARNLESYLEHARQAFPSERTQPRFWSHGRF